MVKRIFTLGFLVVLVMGLAAIAFAAPGIPGLGINSRIRELDLNDEQYSKIQDLHDSFFDKNRELRDEISRQNLELREMYLQQYPDEEAINIKEKQIQGLWDQMDQLKQQQLNAVNDVLTKEQKEKLNNSRHYPRARGFGRGMGFHRGFCNGSSWGRGF